MEKNTRRGFLTTALTATASVGGIMLAAPAMAQQAAPAAESTLAHIRRTGELRASILGSDVPFYMKDLSSGQWSGAGISMLESIASSLDVKLVILEGSTANSLADVQTGKADIAFPYNPNGARALAVRFTDPIYAQPFVYVAREVIGGNTWENLNSADVKLATIIGGLADELANRYSPKAEITGYKTRDDMILAVQSGRADAMLLTLMQGYGVTTRIKELQAVVPLQEPSIVLRSAMVIPMETDFAWRDFLNGWTTNARDTGLIREWILSAFEAAGLDRSIIPNSVQL